MKNSSKVALVLALLLLIGGGLLWLNGRIDSESPNELITRTIQDAQDAAKRGSVDGVLATISDDFNAGGWDKAKLRLLLMKTLGQSRGTDYDVHVAPPKVMLSPKGRPDERLVVTKFAAFNTESGDDIYKTNEPLILLMRQETRRKWLFFQEPYWRVAGIVNLPALPGSDGGGEYNGLLP